MTKENIFNRANLLLEGEIISAVGLQKAKDGKSFVCPKCGNGSKHKGDGIKQKLYHGRLTWHCYSCGEHMSNCDIIAASFGINDTATLAQKLGELYPNLRDSAFFLEGVEKKMDAAKTTDNKGYSQMYEVQRKALTNFLATIGGTWRGLNYDTLRGAGAGYNVKYKSITLPYDEFSFFWRSVEDNGRGVNKGGKRRMYIAAPIQTGKTVNFLTEGEIDSLSVCQALASFAKYFGVVATGSIAFSRMLIDELNKRYDTCAEKPRFIWLGDNDTSGISGAEKIVSSLNAAGYPSTAIYFADVSAPKLDANQYLQDNGNKALQKFLLDAIEETAGELRQREAEIRDRTKQEQIAEAKKRGVQICSLSDYFSNEFDEELNKLSTYEGRATGFENIDEKQIFLPGLYVLGGSPGAGKTTFAWQLLSNLAAGDEFKGRVAEHCVYCSYEMSRLELASKSIARELRRKKLAGGNVLTPSSAEIRRGAARNTVEFKSARAKLLKTMQNLQVAELSNTTLEELLILLKEEKVKAGDMHLTVVVDYLQLIPVENTKATAKERIDEIMLSLKTFQRETNATLIIISSLNRESNKFGGNKLFSFKESGSIEYSADSVWVLERDDEQTDNPRIIQFGCHKNRNGSTYQTTFEYFAQSDYFAPRRDDIKPNSEHKTSNKHKR